MNLDNLSQAEKDELFRKLSDEKAKADNDKREAYEKLRADFVKRVKERFFPYVEDGKESKAWLRGA